MKLFQHSSGIIFSFGFDVWKRRRDPRRVFWSDLTGKRWRPDGKACDFGTFPFEVDPQFIAETATGQVIAFQPGRMIQFTLTHAIPWMDIKILRPETPASGSSPADFPMYDFSEAPE